MDFSKFSDEELKALKAGDYSKLSNESLMSLKQQSAPAAAPDPQQQLVDKLTAQHIDPQVIAAQKAKIGVPNEKRSFALQDNPFQTTGQKIAESLAGSGHDPKIAAAAGTAFQMIPDLLASLPMGGGAKLGVEGAEVAGKAAMESGVGQALRYTAEKKVGALTEAAAALPLKQAAKRELVQETVKTAGKGIGEAETKLGIAQKDSSAIARRVIIETPEKIEQFADKAARLAEKGSDKLAEIGNPETLQFYRKTAEDAIKKAGKTISSESRNKLYQAKQVFADAIGKTKEGADAGFDKAMSTYKEIETVAKNLPKEAVKERQILKVALAQAKNEAKKQAMTRKIVGATVIGGGAFAAKKGFGH